MKALKVRKIVLWVSFIVFLLICLFFALYYWNKEGFDKPNWYSIIILTAIFLGIWFIFAFIYIYSKKSKNIIQRKWPYIILIIFSSVGLILRIFSAYNEIINLNYYKIIVYNFLCLFCYALLIFLMIFCIILIKKEKIEDDLQYSDNVMKTSEKINQNNLKDTKE